MKKLLLLLTVTLLYGSGAFAQAPIPNGSFESGDTMTPTGWIAQGKVARITSQTFTVGGQTATQNAVDGQYFMRLSTDTIMRPNQIDTTIMDTVVRVGRIASAFAYSEKPKHIEFHAMYLPASQVDQMEMQIIFTRFDATTNKSVVMLNYNLKAPPFPIYPWYKFISPEITYTNVPSVDTVIIVISSASTNQSAYGIGTTLWVDRLKFNDNPTSIVETNMFSGLEAYPNPASTNFNLHYTLKEAGQVSISITDLSGKVVMSTSKGTQPAGEYNELLDVSSLKPGMYLYQLNAGGTIGSGKVLIAR